MLGQAYLVYQKIQQNAYCNKLHGKKGEEEYLGSMAKVKERKMNKESMKEQND
jgi:hypothetical protein